MDLFHQADLHGGGVAHVLELVEGLPLVGARQVATVVVRQVLLGQLHDELDVAVLLAARTNLGDLRVVQLLHVVLHLQQNATGGGADAVPIQAYHI